MASSQSKTTISCGESLDIDHITSFYSRFNKGMQKSSVVIVKADTVNKVDTAGLQLLLVVIKELSLSGGRLEWKKPSKKLIEVASLLGLTDQLGLVI